MTKTRNDQYGDQEAQRRFEAALKGAFKTPATPMKDIPPKRPKTQRKRVAKKR
jgi:hypothetical protein